MTLTAPLPPNPPGPMRQQSRHQSGRSLIELMTALVIGLIILGAVLLLTSGSAFNGRSSNARSRLDEDAQLVMSILVPQLRMAGYSRMVNQDIGGIPDRRFDGAGVRGCDNGFANNNAVGWSPQAIHSLTLPCGGNGNPSVAVLYEADIDNTPASAAGLPTDCLGQSLPATASALGATYAEPALATVRLAENRYFLGNASGDGTWSLMCTGSGSANGTAVPFQAGGAQALVPNIETLNLRYGVSDTTPIDTTGRQLFLNTPQRYMTAQEFDAAFLGALNGTEQDPWKRVVAVKLCVTVRAETQEAPTPTPYTDCNGTVVTPPDRFLRRTMTSVVSLRNRL